MTIGELLKEYRLSQNKKQKDFIGQIISPSYYSKVEKNIHRITASDLLALLHYNDISPWDFFNRLDHDDQFKYQQLRDFNDLMLDAYYNNDKRELEHIKKLIDQSSLAKKDKQEQILLVDGWLESMKGSDERPNNEVRRKIKEQIFNIPNLNEAKITLFCNFMRFFDLNTDKMIATQIINQYQKENDIDIQEKILAVIINILVFTIEQHKLNDVNFFIQSATQIKTNPDLFFYKNDLLFFENFIEYLKTNNKKALDKCKIAINNFNLLGMPEYGQQIQLFFDKYEK